MAIENYPPWPETQKAASCDVCCGMKSTLCITWLTKIHGRKKPVFSVFVPAQNSEANPRNWFSKSISQTNLIYPQSIPTILIWIWAMKLRVLRQKMTKSWGSCMKRGHVFRFACCGWHRSLHHRWVLGWCSNSTVLQLGCKKKQSYMSLFIYQACILISAITSNRTRKCNRSKKKVSEQFSPFTGWWTGVLRII